MEERDKANLLKAENLWVYYNDAPALKGVSLFVSQGELVGIIGANGAGKSTLLKAISGLLPARRGTISLGEKNITKVSPHNRTSLGICQVPEGRQIFATLSVYENLLMGFYARRRDGSSALQVNLERVYHLFPVLKERKGQMGGTLSGGEQQMLAIGRALMAHPRFILLDEPSLGLAPMLVREIFQVIATLREAGLGILLVEQNARAALDIADRAYVMETGEITLEGKGKELAQSERVKMAYLGTGAIRRQA